ncbi:MAG: family 10 glycosylhydrolase, partial [Melioribacteraceae bacterium]
MANKRVNVIAIVLLLVISGCTALKVEQYETTLPDLPKVEREFRGAWIATVANINWPNRKDLTTEEQKKEAISILDKLKNNHFNAVIFQARPQCDALYKSDIEPWSYYLTGNQGKAPDPFYDPLEFWIDEAHKRGMELHVWLNPYRAHHIEGGEVTEFSIVKKHPDWVVKLKSGYWWLDPSKKEVQDHSYSVVMDITKRYDIDGIHFDDYFYPYPSYNNDEDFPDEESWKNYLNNGGDLSKADWRRENINVFIQRVYKGIKEIKPNVKFGLSPFGIWRPQHPESIEGFDQYDKLYADAKLWINEGWVDYWAPQLYWKINTIPQSFPILLG